MLVILIDRFTRLVNNVPLQTNVCTLPFFSVCLPHSSSSYMTTDRYCCAARAIILATEIKHQTGIDGNKYTVYSNLLLLQMR